MIKCNYKITKGQKILLRLKARKMASISLNQSVLDWSILNWPIGKNQIIFDVSTWIHIYLAIIGDFVFSWELFNLCYNLTWCFGSFEEFYEHLIKEIGLGWFGLVLWHINHCRLFNNKPYLYTHTRTHTRTHIYIYIYIYTYIYQIYMICTHIWLITFLNEPKPIFFAHSQMFPSIARHHWKFN